MITLPDLTQPYYIVSILAGIGCVFPFVLRSKWYQARLELRKSKATLIKERDEALEQKRTAEGFASMAARSSAEAAKLVNIFKDNVDAQAIEHERKLGELSKKIEAVEARRIKTSSDLQGELEVVKTTAESLSARVKEITSNFRVVLVYLRKYVEYAAGLNDSLAEYAPHGMQIPKPPTIPDDILSAMKEQSSE